MQHTFWLDTCARRLCEIEPSMTAFDADRLAARLWFGSTGMPLYRAMHPVAAAEAWHRLHQHAAGGAVGPDAQRVATAVLRRVAQPR